MTVLASTDIRARHPVLQVIGIGRRLWRRASGPGLTCQRAIYVVTVGHRSCDCGNLIGQLIVGIVAICDRFTGAVLVTGLLKAIANLVVAVRGRIAAGTDGGIYRLVGESIHLVVVPGQVVGGIAVVLLASDFGRTGASASGVQGVFVAG